MTLGMQAVGIVIFFILALLLITAIECLDIYTGVSMSIIIVICLYCAISGTYLMHLAGQI